MLYTRVYIVSTIYLSAIVRPPSVVNSWISWTRCTNSWNVWFASHGSDNLERFPTRSWYSTCPYHVNKCAIMFLTRRCANPWLWSKTPEGKVLLTASADLFFACALQVEPLLELPHCLVMVTVEVPWVDAVVNFWNYEWSWIGRNYKCGSRWYYLIDCVGLHSS